MVCAKCGADVRPSARYCNVCGAAVGRVAVKSDDQKAGHTEIGAPTSTLAMYTSADAEQAPEADVALAGGRAPWGGPSDSSPRNGLAPDGPTAPGDRSSSAHNDKSPEDPASPATSHAHMAPPQTSERPADVADADTQGIPRAGAGSAERGAPQHDVTTAGRTSGAPNRVADALPWPLPTSIIMDGRYRVESVLSSSETENNYQVTDLRGYERCWACGQDYGTDAATDRFCRVCGADMLGREFLMRERHLEDGAAAESTFADSAAATTGAKGGEADAPRIFAQTGRAYCVTPKVVRSAAFPRGARLIAGAATDLGRRRSGELNEDSACVLVLDRVHEDQTLPFGFFAVADGLGGHASGQRASRLTINVMAHTILRQVALPLVGMPSGTAVDDTTFADLLQDAVKAANRSLCATNHEAGLNAGSTVVAALVHGETAYIANAGDSRGYVCDDEGLRCITIDHSLVQTLVAGGLIEPDDVYTHPQRNQIFRSLGDEPDLTVDLFVQQLRPGMRLLLCSDGLWEMVRDPQIEQLLRAAPDPQAACDALIAAANDGGGDDNITAVVIEAR